MVDRMLELASRSVDRLTNRDLASKPRRLGHGSLALDVTRVERPRRLEQDDLDLLLGDRTVLHPARHDQKIAGRELDVTVTELHAKAPTMHEEHLVLVIVVMPHELADELDELNVLAVQLADDLRRPVL